MEKIVHEIGWNQCFLKFYLSVDRMNKVASLKKLQKNFTWILWFFYWSCVIFLGTFEDKEITHVEGEVDPVRDLDIINEVFKKKSWNRSLPLKMKIFSYRNCGSKMKNFSWKLLWIWKPNTKEGRKNWNKNT